MTINKFTGKTKEEAIECAKQAFGPNAVIMNIKEIKPKGLFGIFKSSTYEVTAAMDEKKQTQTKKVLPLSLYHVPELRRNEGGMGILKDHAFLSWMLDPPFVLVVLRTVNHVDGVAQINIVFQQVGNGAVRPVIRVCGVQASMIHAESGVGVHGRRQDLLFLENAGNLAGAAAAGAHSKDPADDGCRLLIHD